MVLFSGSSYEDYKYPSQKMHLREAANDDSVMIVIVELYLEPFKYPRWSFHLRYG